MSNNESEELAAYELALSTLKRYAGPDAIEKSRKEINKEKQNKFSRLAEQADVSLENQALNLLL